MDALIVVHAETGICTLEDAEDSINLYERIAEEMGRFLKRGNRVYFLGEESETPESVCIYQAIKEHFPKAVFIPQRSVRRGYEAQFLETKDRLVNEGIEQTFVCGVSYVLCVDELHSLLIGKPWKGPEYEEARKILDWPKEKFLEVYHKKLNAEVREDLTDAQNLEKLMKQCS